MTRALQLLPSNSIASRIDFVSEGSAAEQALWTEDHARQCRHLLQRAKTVRFAFSTKRVKGYTIILIQSALQ
jgi:hypothetical protein